MRHGSLFSGIGGFDLAAEWMGWENVFHCEWMEFPRKVLDYHFPNADSHIDICKTDFRKYANTIDVLTGGFPCQPFSLAGKRKGTDDERYLWGEMLRAIQEIKPRFVIAENVFGITNIDGGLVFQQVCLDLENEGYEVQPFIIPACAKNAPHRRDRCWFIGVRNAADNNSIVRREGREFEPGKQSRHGESNESCNTEIDGIITNCKDLRQGSTKAIDKWGKPITQDRCEIRNPFDTNGIIGNATYSNGNAFNERNSNDEVNTSQGGQYALGDTQSLYIKQPTLEHPLCIGQERGLYEEQSKIATGEQFSERNARSIKSPCWENFPTQSPICGGDDGLPTELDGITFSKWRAESIKGYGNAIVPQIALQLFQILETL